MPRAAFRTSLTSEPLALDPRVSATSEFDVPSADDDLFAPEAILPGGIAVLAITGPLEHHQHWMWTSYEEITQQVAAAFECEEVAAVVLKIDSPGGVAAGMGEMHRALRAMSDAHPEKPLIAYVDEQACSAAYHLASACDEIWLPPAGEAGSVGVIRCTVDESAALEKQGVKVRYLVTGERKADLHPGAPITDEVLQVAQSKVDYLGSLFFEAVAEARGMTPAAVEALQAAVFQGPAAVAAGLADGVVEGWTKFLALLSGTLQATRARVGSFGATGAPPPPTGNYMKAKILTLTKARDEAAANFKTALAALSAKPNDTKLAEAATKALAAKTETSAALSAAQAKMETIKHVKHEEKVVERNVEEEEEEEEAEEEESTDGSTEDSSKGSTSTGGSTGASAEEEEEERAIAKAFDAGGPGLYTPKRLVRLARQVVEKATGEQVHGTKALFGALDAIGQRVAKTSALEKRLAKLEAEANATKVDAMLATALAEGKVTKAQVPDLRAKGLKDRSLLKGWLQGLPKAYRTTQDGALAPRIDSDGNPIGGPSAEQQAAEARLVADAKTPEEAAKRLADFRARLSTQGAAGAPKH